MSKAKKIICIFMVFFILFAISFNTFAVSTGGAYILCDFGEAYMYLSNTHLYPEKITNDYYQNEYGVTCVWGITSMPSSWVNRSIYLNSKFSFSSQNNVGLLKITCTPGDVSNALLDETYSPYIIDGETNTNLGGQVVFNSDNSFTISYDGKIPSSFYIRYKATFSDMDTGLGSIYYDINYSPKSYLEQEKEEANKGGNDSVDELGSVIPNDSGGFIDSLSNFVGAMAYDGTECDWKFPALYLPAIQGVMPKINLTDELEIPFEYWISKIPSGILTLVRSLLTIALIVFCFKELYNIISYVLTLRGGASNE